MHETKIPQKIELHSYMPGVDTPGMVGATLGISQLMTGSSANQVFSYLGHFELDSNEHSGY